MLVDLVPRLRRFEELDVTEETVAALEIAGDCLAHINGKRELVVTVTLSMHHDQPSTPVGVAHQVEYWPTAYGPLPGRGDLKRPTDRIP